MLGQRCNMANSASSSPSNRRRSPRRKPRSSVKVECRKGSHGLGADLSVSLLDTSDSGIRLIVTQALDIMAEVEIIIAGYGMKQAIKRMGHVRWQVKMENGQ